MVEAGEWYLMDESWGTQAERTQMRMQSRRRGGDALGSAVKALLATAGNPSVLSGTRVASMRASAPAHEDTFRNWADAAAVSHRDLEIPEHERFQIYRKLQITRGVHDEM